MTLPSLNSRLSLSKSLFKITDFACFTPLALSDSYDSAERAGKVAETDSEIPVDVQTSVTASISIKCMD